MGVDKLEDLKWHVHDIAIPRLTENQANFLLPLYKDFQRVRVDTGNCFGNVVKSVQRFTDENVAVKILPIPQDQQNDGIPSSILNHVSILKDLNHPNIVRLLKVLATQEDVYLLFEHFDLNLRRFLGNPMFSVEKCHRSIIRQVLSGLANCHSHNIVHGDLSTYNVLLEYHRDENHILKLCGLRAPKIASPNSINMGDPCYKAPELLMDLTNYTIAVDMWSMGCIFAEVYMRRPLFISKDEPGVLAEIFCLFGTPTEETWPGMSSMCNFNTAFKHPIEPKDLAEVFIGLDPSALDLLSKMLCPCPNGRISVYEALDHPFLRL